MTVTRRQTVIASAVVAVLAAAAAGLWYLNRAQAAERAAPSWLDPQQPPPGVAAPLIATVSAGESWAANRPRHMSACCTGQTAGLRIRRTYASTLAANPDSLVR